MRKPGAIIPAARALHDDLIRRKLHPPDDGGDWALFNSPCDGCVDLAQLVVEAYAVTWQGPRAEQR